MNEKHYSAFSELWATANEISGNGKVLSSNAMFMIFNALKKYPFEIVQQALETHITSNHFAPTVAGIIDIIVKGTGGSRPTADEAWNEIPKSEDYPCVWTDEMAQAWALVANNYYDGDKIGARMGFKSAYERLCEEAKLFGKLVKWSFSHGANKDLYKTTVERAVSQGRLQKQQADSILQALPAPITNDGLLLIGSKKADKATANAKMREKLAEMKALLDDADREETKQLNAEKLAVKQARIDKENLAIKLLSIEELNAIESNFAHNGIPVDLVDVVVH